ncbi:hypothetical protein HZA98_01830 [Candidatus Woesearchaeota archaeon]|nr:hypothetical protein [Candidatus Woesearchaeota archaeon]
MFVYNPHHEKILIERLNKAEEILLHFPAKYCFITGSFLYKKKYKDIDVFILSRSKKKYKYDKIIKITVLDFNQLYSLLYHSLSKACIAKNILPQKDVKVTLANYWSVINDSIPALLNEKKNFTKSIRSLVLYTEYFKTGEVLDSFQLSEKCNSFKSTKEVLKYIQEESPKAIQKNASFAYIKRFFYTQAGVYKEVKEYKAQNILYELTHRITKGNHG